MWPGSNAAASFAGPLPTSPLRLLTPRNHGAAAWLARAYGGGLVDGDDRVAARSAGGASVLVPTQASTKVYRCMRGARGALVPRWMPAGCWSSRPTRSSRSPVRRYRQVQRFDIAADAGRRGRPWRRAARVGERWQFAEYESRLRSVDGRPGARRDRIMPRTATWRSASAASTCCGRWCGRGALADRPRA